MSTESFDDIVGLNPIRSQSQRRASQATTDALLAVVHQKVRQPSRDDAWVMRTLRRPDHPDVKITVSRYGEAASKRRAGMIARIAIIEYLRDGNSNSGFRTTYTISDSPDGLQIGRSAGVAKPLVTFDERTSPLPGAIRMGNVDMAELQVRRNALDAERLENELDLSVVTEAEAVQVLTMIQEAQPQAKQH